MTSVDGRQNHFLGVPVPGEHDAVEEGSTRRNASPLVKGLEIGLGTAIVGSTALGVVEYATNAQFRQAVNSDVAAIVDNFQGASSTDALTQPKGSGVQPTIETTTTTNTEIAAEQQQAYYDAQAWLQGKDNPNSNIMSRVDAITSDANQIGKHLSTGYRWDTVVADPVVSKEGDARMMLFLKDANGKHIIVIATAGDLKRISDSPPQIENTGNLDLKGSGGALNPLDPAPATPQAVVKGIQQYTTGFNRPLAIVGLTIPLNSVSQQVDSYTLVQWDEAHMGATAALQGYVDGTSQEIPSFVFTDAKQAADGLFNAPQSSLPGVLNIQTLG